MTLCPKFSFFSVLFWISIIQIVVFITELTIGGISPKSFLAASSETLESMGQKVGIASIISITSILIMIYFMLSAKLL